MLVSVASKSILGQRLAGIRKFNKLSQEQFSAKLGISRSAYQYYERGERELPMSVCAAIADVFGVDPIWFMFDDGERRVLAQDAENTKRCCDILAYIDQRLLELGRTISPANKKALAVQFTAERITSGVDLSELENQRKIALDNMIVNLSLVA